MTSGTPITTRYHNNHKKLLTANDANKLMCIVILAHFKDLQSRKILVNFLFISLFRLYIVLTSYIVTHTYYILYVNEG